MRRFRYYEIGNEMAGLRSVEVIEKAETQEDTRYRIQYLCCEKKSEQSHRQIYRRVLADSKMCTLCGKRTTGYKLALAALDRRGQTPREYPDYGVVPPEWPIASRTFGSHWYGR